MHLHRLRWRLMSVVGIPVSACTTLVVSCTPGAHADHVEAPATSTAPSNTSTERSAATTPVARKCGEDEMREYVCGASRVGGAPAPYETCSPISDDLQSWHPLSSLSGARTGMLFNAEITATRRQQRDSAKPDSACCYSSCTPIEVSAKASPFPPKNLSRVVCIDAMTSTSAPAPTRPDCPAGVAFLAGYAQPFDAEESERQSNAFGARCCYREAVLPPRPRPRRPRGLVLQGHDGPLLAPRRRRTDWMASVGQLQVPSDRHERAQLAEHWRRDAAFEHASVASFARLSLSLMAVGAPPHLIADTHRAGLDEVRHAELSYAVAAFYGETPVGPGRLELTNSASELASDLESLVEDIFIDGCVGEGVAALLAQHASNLTSDPELATIFDTIFEDESRHAELAWRIVAWCLRQEPALATRLLRQLDTLACAPTTNGDDAPAIPAFGVLGTTAETTIRQTLLREVARPCLEALVAHTSLSGDTYSRRRSNGRRNSRRVSQEISGTAD